MLGGATGDAPFLLARVHQGLMLVALTFLIGWVLNLTLAGHRDAFDRALPVVAMTAICIILTIIAANSRDELLNLGLLLLLAAFLHNTIGYVLGYWMAGMARLPESDRRTVAFEVGMQNGGMAVGLALDVLKSTSAALAPAIFGTWMNVTGSTLASWWRDQPTGEEAT